MCSHERELTKGSLSLCEATLEHCRRLKTEIPMGMEWKIEVTSKLIETRGCPCMLNVLQMNCPIDICLFEHGEDHIMRIGLGHYVEVKVQVK